MVTIRYVRGEPVVKTSLDLPYSLWLRLDKVAPYRKKDYVIRCLDQSLADVEIAEEDRLKLTRAITRDGTVNPTEPCSWDSVKDDILKELSWISDAIPHVGVTSQMIDAVVAWGVKNGRGLKKADVKRGLMEWSGSIKKD